MTGVLLAIWVFATGERITGIPLGLGNVATQLLALFAIAAILLIFRYRATREEAA